MFKPVSSKVNFPQLEENILGLWKSQNVFPRSTEARRGGRRFVFYEGPPFANGSPGIHHVLARVFKDIIVRYKVMRGYYVPRIAGWDTHGLPVELEIEKQLGFSGKDQIEKYGVEEFNRRCRESVFKYLKEWNSLTERIAYWVDLEHAYKTMDNTYIESVWWALKRMWDSGFIYQGYKVTPHCPRCETSLSSHEVAQGYEDVDDPSVYIKFKIAKSLYSEPGFLDKLRGGYGDKVADAIDEEVNRVIGQAHETARQILTENRSKLVFLAEKLIAQETLEGKELEKVFEELAISKPARKVRKTKVPAPVKPVGEVERAPKPKKAPAVPRLVPKQTPAIPD